MPADSYGIVVEGEYDSTVYETIIRKLASHPVRIMPRACGGKPNLRREFSGFLEGFKHQELGGPVDMAIVITDADGKDPAEIEAILRAKVVERHYPFPVHFYAVRNAMDAWLLADHNAINSACQARGGRRVTSTARDPEQLLRPKESFRKLLADHKVVYTAEVCREIAEAVDLNALSQACPRFRSFAELVDC